MKKQKTLALLLSLVMLAGCFIGCSSTKTESESTTTEATTEKEETTETTEEKTSTEPEEIPVVTIGLPQNAKVEDYETNALTLHLEEAAGVDLQFVMFSSDAAERTTQLALMVSSGETLPDILWNFGGLTASQIAEYGHDGVFIDLTEYLAGSEIYNDAVETMILDETIRERVKTQGIDYETGEQYGAPIVAYSPNYIPCNPFFYQPWLDAIGEDIPKTVDELYTVLEKFAATDLNGNGKKDEIPSVGMYNASRADVTQYVINAYVYWNGDLNVTDGTIWTPYVTDEFRQGLITVNDMVNKGLIYEGTFTISSSDELMAFATPSDNVPIVGVVCGSQDLIFAEGTMVKDYVGSYPLAAETDKGGFTPLLNVNPSFNTFISGDCQNPDAAWKVMEQMYTAESAAIIRYGREGVGWEWIEPGNGKTSWGTMLDIDAKIRILDNSLWAEQNNENWHVCASTFINYIEYGPLFEDKDDFASDKTNLFVDHYRKWEEYGNHVDEIVGTLIYTNEENELVTEYNTMWEYIDEQVALFCTGILDPNNDADWNNFVNTVNDMGLSKCLELAQTAYDRTH